MAIKQSTVLPPGFKVTKCPPAEANAPSLYTLRRQAEQKAEMEYEAEHRAERMAEDAAAFYVANGYHATGFDSNGNLE